MRQHYFTESVSVWENALLQAGSGALPVFSGVPYQRGQGIDSIFRGLFRSTWLAVRKVGLEVGKVMTGSEVTSDYLKQGVDPKQALRKRVCQAAGRTLTKVGQHLTQEGEGLGLRPRQKSIKGINTRGRAKRRTLNIYDG